MISTPTDAAWDILINWWFNHMGDTTLGKLCQGLQFQATNPHGNLKKQKKTNKQNNNFLLRISMREIWFLWAQKHLGWIISTCKHAVKQIRVLDNLRKKWTLCVPNKIQKSPDCLKSVTIVSVPLPKVTFPFKSRKSCLFVNNFPGTTINVFKSVIQILWTWTVFEHSAMQRFSSV